MNKLIAFAFILGLSASAAQAMPFVPDQGPTNIVTQVAEGCGAGFHRNPRGICVRNGAPRVVVVPGAVVVAPRVVVAPCGGRGQREVCVVGRGCRMVCR